MTQKRGVIILSGGLDSTTLLHYLRAKDYLLEGISFSYGQRHSKELQFAEYWGKRCLEQYRVLELNIADIISHSSLINRDIDVPTAEKDQQITIVPGRNTVMLAIAIAYAENFGIDHVFYGAHLSDRSVYLDCRREYVLALSLASQLGTTNNVEVEAPFLIMKKSDIVKLGLNLSVDYTKTWSCYENNERPCVVCESCQERVKAFYENGVKDPQMSIEEWKRAIVTMKS